MKMGTNLDLAFIHVNGKIGDNDFGRCCWSYGLGGSGRRYVCSTGTLYGRDSSATKDLRAGASATSCTTTTGLRLGGDDLLKICETMGLTATRAN